MFVLLISKSTFVPFLACVINGAFYASEPLTLQYEGCNWHLNSALPLYQPAEQGVESSRPSRQTDSWTSPTGGEDGIQASKAESFMTRLVDERRRKRPEPFPAQEWGIMAAQQPATQAPSIILGTQKIVVGNKLSSSWLCKQVPNSSR